MTGLIVHEWLEQRGGAEKVVDAMREAFPHAGLFALWNDAPEKYQDAKESWLAHTPLRRHKALATPILPFTWRHLVKSERRLDWVLISSHLFAHQVDVHDPSGASIPKFAYVHTPARYVWEPELDERGSSLLVRAASSVLRPLDRQRAKELTSIAANSAFVRERIAHTWERDATVIYPPVDIESIADTVDWRTRLCGDELRVLEELPDYFILGASRLVRYKRLDWVIQCGDRLRVPVVIAGNGPDRDRLVHAASEAEVPVAFVDAPSTQLLYALYQQAAVFVFPAVEDFGIMPVEAQATGTPVATTAIGGAKESHIEGVSGVAAAEDTIASLSAAIEESLCLPSFDRLESVSQFSKETFISKIREWVPCNLES